MTVAAARPAPRKAPAKRPRNFDHVLSEAEAIGLTVHRTGPTQAKITCPCPGHVSPDDHVSVSDLGDRFLAKCHPNDQHAPAEILAALGWDAWRYTTTTHTPTDPKPRGKIDCTYAYTDEKGKEIYQVVRLKDPKGFYQRHMGPSGDWINNIQGKRRVLFRLQDVLAAKRARRVICVTEGEKDALNVAALGICATTNAMGAGNWRSEYTETLTGADVVILPDNDTEGEKHAQVVMAALRGKTASLRLVKLPDRNGQHVKDVSDWTTAGGTHEELEELIALAPQVEASPEANPANPADEASSPGRPSIPDFRKSDWWNGQVMVSVAGDDIAFCSDRAVWLHWNGKHWEWDKSMVAVYQQAKRAIQQIYALASMTDDDSKRAALASWALGSESSNRVRSMVFQAQSESYIQRVMTDFDINPDVFNVQNGTIDLKTGELKPHRRGDLLTRCAPTVYTPDQDTGTWAKFIDDITLGRKDLARYLAQCVGYAMTGHTDEDQLFYLYQRGRNGKSSFMEAIYKMAGPVDKGGYGGSLSYSVLMLRPRDAANRGHRDEIMSLAGARILIVSECPDGMTLDSALIKNMTGGDTITGSVKFGGTFSYTPQYTPFLYGNYKPKIGEVDEGTWARPRLIPFDAYFEKGRNEIVGLRKALQTTYVNEVLTWAVAGAVDWYQNGLVEPACVTEATAQFRSEQDHVRQFLEERTVSGPTMRVMVSELYQDYSLWCMASNEFAAFGKTQFNERVERLGHQKAKDGRGYFWRGLGRLHHE